MLLAGQHRLQLEEQNCRRASSRGLIPRAKVKTVKMTFVIVFGKARQGHADLSVMSLSRLRDTLQWYSSEGSDTLFKNKWPPEKYNPYIG
jgi:hypothetical protein